MVGPWDTQQYELVLSGSQLSGTTLQSVFGSVEEEVNCLLCLGNTKDT